MRNATMGLLSLTIKQLPAYGARQPGRAKSFERRDAQAFALREMRKRRRQKQTLTYARPGGLPCARQGCARTGSDKTKLMLLGVFPACSQLVAVYLTQPHGVSRESPLVGHTRLQTNNF